MREMREVSEFQRQIAQEKQNEIAELIKQYAPNQQEANSNIEDLNALMKIIDLAKAGQQQNAAPLTAPAAESQLSDEEAQKLAQFLKGNKHLRNFLPQFAALSGADFEKIKRCL
jgi:tellurite resistance protein